jgi:hypothetical protein
MSELTLYLRKFSPISGIIGTADYSTASNPNETNIPGLLRDENRP